MQPHILITAATFPELKCLDKLEGISGSGGSYMYHGTKLSTLVTGVGSVFTVWSIMNYIHSNSQKPDYLINIGIAGSFKDIYPVRTVVTVATDCFADLGVENGDNLLSVWDLGLTDPSGFPFENGILKGDSNLLSLAENLFPLVNGITVNRASGSERTIDMLRVKYNPDIETMEGAAIYFTGLSENIPSLVVRSVSNMVEQRDREAWDIPGSLSALGEAVGELLVKLIS
ncbi:MAG: futalosine hydrolase [Bacteroidales bacterium]|nr:futalosine hydrolase [Bacteroidales bacterium]